MARKSVTVAISEEGRDKGKVFVIEEWPAAYAERWAWKVFFALANAGVDMPEGVQQAGMAGLAVMGFGALARMKFDDAAPLLDDMLTCVQICPDTRNPDVKRALVDGDTEEVWTRLKLRAEVFTLHTGFSIPAFKSQNTSHLETSAGQSPLPNTPMSRPRSAPRSLPVRQR